VPGVLPGESGQARVLNGKLGQGIDRISSENLKPSSSSPAEVVTAINRAWVSGRLGDLEPLLHPRAIIVGADLSRLAEGRDACIASYRDFLSAATVHEFQERDVRVEEYEGAAVVSYGYRIRYESGGERHQEEGREVLLLVRSVDGWQGAWRQVLPAG
jgi:hypothetical protein